MKTCIGRVAANAVGIVETARFLHAEMSLEEIWSLLRGCVVGDRLLKHLLKDCLVRCSITALTAMCGVD